MVVPTRVPPRFVPTLTEVVGRPAAAPDPSGLPGQAPAAEAPAAVQTNPAQPPGPLPEGFEEDVVHRVMQRVDVMLEQRLQQAIAHVIEEQTRSLVPRLREEVECVVRQSVYEAVAQELLAGERGSP